MSSYRMAQRQGEARRPAGSAACPACGGALAADAAHCAACGFTGEDCLRMFPGSPPPLLSILDAADLWSAQDQRRIEAARGKLLRLFPQFRFHICSVALAEDISLPAFGFWMLNVSPLYVGETADGRAWSVLLLVNANDGAMAVAQGYAAERWLGDEEWRKILWTMAPSWKAGDAGGAVLRFLESTTTFLTHTWKARGLRRAKRAKP
jgi:hypothetical protein